MPFTKSPTPSGGDLVAEYPATKLQSRHTTRFAVNDPVKFSLSHASNAVVKLAVEYLSQPYPLIEVQCPQRYRVFIATDAM